MFNPMRVLRDAQASIEQVTTARLDRCEKRLQSYERRVQNESTKITARSTTELVESRLRELGL